MKKIPPKSALFAAFFALAAVILSGCILEPVDLKSFLEDEKVQGIIDRDGTVNIMDGSEPGLTAGNRSITGLDPSKYYAVEEWNEENEFVGVQFVSSDGTRTASLTGIGKVSGGEITELKNFWNYRVREAKPVSGRAAYLDPTITSITISDGVVRLPTPSGRLHLNLGLAIPGLDSYEIVKIPIVSPPSGFASSIMTIMPGTIELEGEGTETDYVFALRDSNGNVEDFFVLKVIVDFVPEPEGMKVTLGFTGDNSPTITPTSLSYSQNRTAPITFNITGANQYDNYATNGIKWYLDDDPVNPIGTGPSYTIPLNTSAVRFRMIGVYTITVEATKNGIPYSTVIAVTVTP